MQRRCEQIRTSGCGRRRSRGDLRQPEGWRVAVSFAEPGGPVAVPIHFGPALPRPPVSSVAPSGCQNLRIHFLMARLYVHGVRWISLLWICWALASQLANAQSTNAPGSTDTNSPSRFIEVAGQVEYTRSGTNWQTAVTGLALQPGDRVRTRERSRAAVQLSDRSVIRLGERTTLEILPPRRSEKRRFGLPSGSLFFFNREKPADVEFDTPLAAGAIRGTEFLLEVAEADGALHLALIDGSVGLQAASGDVSMQRGEDLRLAPGQPPQKTALVNANTAIQWALYYPAVLNPDELQLSTDESQKLGQVLGKYRAGDLLGALAGLPAAAIADGAGVKCFRAQLELVVGRVDEAKHLLTGVPDGFAPKLALTELIALVLQGASERGAPAPRDSDSRRAGALRSASELLAHSYASQARADLIGARAAARQAVELTPQFGIAHARLAELEFAFGNRRAALGALDRALSLSPRLTPAHALRGFIALDQGDSRAAQRAFDHARELDAAFGPAWLGSGLCLLHERQFPEARSAFQAAAALEPQRGLFRSYLGKAASELGDAKAAEKEFNLAKRLDANDPTAWLYSALHLWQQNRLNEAIRDLEQSADLNDNRAVFRSRLQLDDDRSVRSANLAALYDDVGVPDASRRAAAQAVSDSYANFSGHLFLSESYQSQQEGNRFDLRLETARQSELLVANLLAPVGAGNLSQLLSQQEHLRFFEPRPVGLSSLTEYSSNGDWRQTAAVFGTLGGFSYAFDSIYESFAGQQPNGQSENRQFILTLKERITADDEAYFQIGDRKSSAGDVANHYDPADAREGFQVTEKQEPTIYAGWHHAWSPGSHTLLLFGRLDDQLALQDPNENILFLKTGLFGGGVKAVSYGPLDPPVQLDFTSDFTLYSAELQQIWEGPRWSVVTGGRWQSGEVTSHAAQTRIFPATDQTVSSDLERGNAYAYGSWQVVDPLRLVAGVSYDHILFPNNVDLPPLSTGETSRDLLSPKAGLLLEPWKRGLLRASYTKSLGGLYFDNSVRLEPTQVGGFNQAFRSLIPESVAGLVPGTEFETAGVGFDQSLSSGTWFGVEVEQLTSSGDREVGAFKSFVELVGDATATSTRQTLDFRERSLAAYAGQLLGQSFSVGARYRVSEARLQQGFPGIPADALGLAELQAERQAILQQLSLTANFHHRSGVFAQWESAWYHQNNAGDPTVAASEAFWQHNLAVGYRFPRRYAEIRLGLWNIFDTDYRLNPLNIHAELWRGRTFTASLRLGF